MRPHSVNSEIVKLLRPFGFIGLLLALHSPSLASNDTCIELLVEESLACEQRAHVLEVGLSHWSKEEIDERQSQLLDQVAGIERCLEKGQEALRAGRVAWEEKVQRMNKQHRHSANHLREAALRSTVSKLLNRTRKRLSKLQAHVAK